MTEENEPIVKVTLTTIYDKLLDLDKKVDPMVSHSERLRKVEQQLAAQWVVVGIVVVALGGMLVRVFTGA
jgi:hypothetical protein